MNVGKILADARKVASILQARTTVAAIEVVIDWWTDIVVLTSMNAKKERITATRRQQFAETVLGVLIVIVSKDTKGRTTGLANVKHAHPLLLTGILMVP